MSRGPRVLVQVVAVHIPPDGATSRGGPWPPLQCASRPVDSLLCLSMDLNPSSSGPWTRQPATFPRLQHSLNVPCAKFQIRNSSPLSQSAIHFFFQIVLLC